MASRWGIKAAGASLSGAFGGLLGGGLGSLPKRGILVRWRWIFLIEGLMTLAVAGWTYWVMPNSIAMSSFLTEEEKAVATRRIDEENKMIVGSEDRSPWRWDIMKKAVWNANTQLVSLGIMMSLLALTSLSLFMVCADCNRITREFSANDILHSPLCCDPWVIHLYSPNF